MEKTLLVTCHAPEAVRAAIEVGLAGAERILFLTRAHGKPVVLIGREAESPAQG